MPDLLNVILDTNIFVAAGFNGRSASARIIEAVRSGHLVWAATFAELFRTEDHFTGATHPDHFDPISDPDDRKFAAPRRQPVLH